MIKNPLNNIKPVGQEVKPRAPKTLNISEKQDGKRHAFNQNKDACKFCQEQAHKGAGGPPWHRNCRCVEIS